MHNGNDVVKLIEQLKAYGRALALGAPSEMFHLNIPCVVLVVFDHQSTMHTAWERMQQDPFFTHLIPYILGKTFATIYEYPLQKWLRLDGTRQWCIP